MKKYIYKVFFLFSFTIFLIFVQVQITKPLFSKIYNKCNFVLPDTTKILLVGNSHMKTSLDNDVIPNSLNLSYAGDNIMYSYFKINLVLENRNNVQTIIVNFTPDMFSGSYDSFIFQDNYLPFLDNNYVDLLYDHSEGVIRGFIVKKILKTVSLENEFKKVSDLIISYLITKSYVQLNSKLPKLIIQYINSFGNTNIRDFEVFSDKYISYKSNLSDAQTTSRIRRHFYNDNQMYDVSGISVQFLDSIINYSKRTNKNLIFINTPQYGKYYENIPTKFIDCYNSQVSLLKKRNIPIINENNSIQFPDSCFGDGDHLNAYGMEYFSHMMKDSIKKYEDSVINRQLIK